MKKSKLSARILNKSAKVPAILAILIIVAIGVYLLAVSHAQVPYVGGEGENGTLSAGMTILSDANASNGKYVQFGSSTGASLAHIMVIMMENQPVGNIIGSSSAPYQTQLSAQYEYASDSYGLGHYSLDNYLGAISGNWYSWSTGDCSPGSGCQTSDTTLINQLDGKSIPWHAYMEGMPSNCYASDASYGSGDEYVVHHNPFVYFTSTPSTDCTNISPATSMISDLNAGTPPAFVWLSPSICHDGGQDLSCSTISNGDQYLKSEIPSIQSTTWYKNNGVIVLTYDEGGGNQGEDLTGSGNHIATIVISAATAGKPNYTAYVNHFGLLSAIEKAYGVPCLGQACTTSNGQMPL